MLMSCDAHTKEPAEGTWPSVGKSDLIDSYKSSCMTHAQHQAQIALHKVLLMVHRHAFSAGMEKALSVPLTQDPNVQHSRSTTNLSRFRPPPLQQPGAPLTGKGQQAEGALSPLGKATEGPVSPFARAQVFVWTIYLQGIVHGAGKADFAALFRHLNEHVDSSLSGSQRPLECGSHSFCCSKCSITASIAHLSTCCVASKELQHIAVCMLLLSILLVTHCLC